MFVKKETVSNVNSSVSLENEKLKYAIGNRFFEEGKEILQVNGGISKIEIIQGIIFVEYFSDDTGMEETIKLTEKTNEFQITDSFKNLMIRGGRGNVITSLSYDEDYNTLLKILDLNSLKELWKGPSNPYGFDIIDQQFVLLWDNENIYIHDYSNNIEKFSISFELISDKFNISRELKVDKVLRTTNGSNLVICLETGILVLVDLVNLELIKVVDLYVILNDQKAIINNIHFDSRVNIVKFFSGGGYYEVDITEGNIVNKTLFENYDEGNWWISRSNDYGKYMTFVGSKDGVSTFSNSFGIFDSEKKEVVWYDGILKEEREEKGFFLSPPIYSGNRLVVVDSEKNMHVYEKT